MIIWLASYPRSGNTFLRLIFHNVYGIKSTSIYKEAFTTDSRVNELIGHFPLNSLEEARRSPDIFFVKTHGLPPDDNPAICLVRDGRDSLVSWARLKMVHHQLPRWRNYLWYLCRKNKRFYYLLKDLIVDPHYYGGWSRNVLAWKDRAQSAPTFFIRYQDLVEDPLGWSRRALEAMDYKDIDAHGQVPNFEQLREKNPRFFRKGKIGTWKKEMPEDLKELFWEKHRDGLKTFGLEDQ